LAYCRFYAELNDFLPPADRQRLLARRLESAGSVKDFFEGFGVPHPEVALILVDARPVGFGHQVLPGDRVSVFPRFRGLPLADAPVLRPPLVAPIRFLLDVHLGRLAGLLRLAGFDAAYDNHASDEDLARRARGESRVLLTRDRDLLKRRDVVWGYFVRETRPRAQLAEVVRQFDLTQAFEPWTRCGRCNDRLDNVALSEVIAAVPPRVRGAPHTYRRCRGCGRVYWDGSHVRGIERILAMTG